MYEYRGVSYLVVRVDKRKDIMLRVAFLHLCTTNRVVQSGKAEDSGVEVDIPREDFSAGSEPEAYPNIDVEIVKSQNFSILFTFRLIDPTKTKIKQMVDR